MAGPLSGISSAPQIPLSQTQNSQSSSRERESNVTSVTSEQDNETQNVSQTRAVTETQETETSNTGETTQNAVLASADEQTVSDERERGSLLDISV